MVTMLKTLDKIAREKQRDVLYLTFHHSESLVLETDVGKFDWEGSAMRKKVIGVLDGLHISYQACFSPLPTDGTIILAMPYKGQIYIDMPYDESNTLYKQIVSHLKHPDGSMKLPNVGFWHYPLQEAMKNAEQKERFDARTSSLSAQYHDHTLTIKAPSRFFADGLKSNYGQYIHEIAQTLSSTPINILYEVDPNLAEHSQPQAPKVSSDTASTSLVDGFIDPRFTFDNFVVGSGNEICHAASRAVADNPGAIYNPLYLYGGIGLGKTHLINAVANAFIQKDHTKVVCRTGERFTNELIQAIRNGTSEQFRNQYRQVDVLIIDDIQFIAGKEKTQEELLHTFNALYEEKKQIILTSDRSPCELTNFMERLRSRFNWGLVVDIQAPDLEARLAILSSKAELAGITLDKDIAHLLAARITNNVRELEGALTRLTAHSSLTGRIMNLEIARYVLRDLLHEDVL